MNNVWKWTAKDKSGKRVPAADGAEFFVSRGPESERELRYEAQRLLNHRIQMEWYAAGQPENWDNPVYTVDTVEPAGMSDAAAAPHGVWQPPGAKPINMPQPALPEEK